MKTLMGYLNRKIRDFSMNFFSFENKRRKTHTMKGERECVCVQFGYCNLEEKGRVQVSFQVVSSITSTRIIKKGVLDYFSISRV